MPQSVRSAVGQPIRRFAALCDAAFRAALARYGFVPTRATMESSTYLASRLYRANERYIKVSATTHWRDAPACCGVDLGEGSETWPESDWNAIALWQLGRESMAPPRKDPFYLRDVKDLPTVLQRMCKVLLRDGKGFLAGDLQAFRKARAASAAGRQPYMIGEIGRDGLYAARADPESAALQALFASQSELGADSVPPPRKRRRGGLSPQDGKDHVRRRRS